MNNWGVKSVSVVLTPTKMAGSFPLILCSCGSDKCQIFGVEFWILVISFLWVQIIPKCEHAESLKICVFVKKENVQRKRWLWRACMSVQTQILADG